MSGSTYKIIELVGTSETSWDDAAKSAIETAGKTLRELESVRVTSNDGNLLRSRERWVGRRTGLAVKPQRASGVIRTSHCWVNTACDRATCQRGPSADWLRCSCGL